MGYSVSVRIFLDLPMRDKEWCGQLRTWPPFLHKFQEPDTCFYSWVTVTGFNLNATVACKFNGEFCEFSHTCFTYIINIKLFFKWLIIACVFHEYLIIFFFFFVDDSLLLHILYNYQIIWKSWYQNNAIIVSFLKLTIASLISLISNYLF